MLITSNNFRNDNWDDLFIAELKEFSTFPLVALLSNSLDSENFKFGYNLLSINRMFKTSKTELQDIPENISS